MASRRNSSECPGRAVNRGFIVSACLAGLNCTYNGKNKLKPRIRELIKKGVAVAVCPEVLGGSSVPRERCEISGGDGGQVLAKKAAVKTLSGKDITATMVLGAKKTLAIAKRLGIKRAILKSNSPSCGYGMIYDGTFKDKLKKGNGVTAALLLRYSIKIYNEKDDDYGL
ncbi:MAG: DUF523 domain-containing protein [Candidatus Omnitrophica bacterium]|nr:DUF523 domain-containing protein [Candidatus Omnitrophota bacterium]